MEAGLKKFTYSLLNEISPFIDQIAYDKDIEAEKFMKAVDKFIYDLTGDDSILDVYKGDCKIERIEKFNGFLERLKSKNKETLKALKKENMEDFDHRILIASYVTTLILGHMIEKYPEQMNSYNVAANI